MKFILPITALIFSLLSCTTTHDSGKIYTLETLQNNTLEQFNYGEESSMLLKEMTSDRTNSIEYTSKVSHLYEALLEIDSVTALSVSLVEKYKKELFISIGAPKAESPPYPSQSSNPCRPILYDLSRIKHTGESSVLDDLSRKRIVASIRNYRGEICRLLQESHFIEKDREAFYFVDPNINTFRDDKDFNRQFDERIKKSNISMDDMEVTKRIYRILSKTDENWRSIIGEKDSWTDVLSVLLSIENDILTVRAMAFHQIQYRMGCGADFNFSHILPIIHGPNAAGAGDTVQLKVFMGAYNAAQNPAFELSGGAKLEKIEAGIGYITVVIPKSEKSVINGKISVRNKSGVVKTMAWEHTIRAISE